MQWGCRLVDSIRVWVFLLQTALRIGSVVFDLSPGLDEAAAVGRAFINAVSVQALGVLVNALRKFFHYGTCLFEGLLFVKREVVFESGRTLLA